MQGRSAAAQAVRSPVTAAAVMAAAGVAAQRRRQSSGKESEARTSAPRGRANETGRSLSLSRALFLPPSFSLYLQLYLAPWSSSSPPPLLLSLYGRGGCGF